MDSEADTEKDSEAARDGPAMTEKRGGGARGMLPGAAALAARGARGARGAGGRRLPAARVGGDKTKTKKQMAKTHRREGSGSASTPVALRRGWSGLVTERGQGGGGRGPKTTMGRVLTDRAKSLPTDFTISRKVATASTVRAGHHCFPGSRIQEIKRHGTHINPARKFARRLAESQPRVSGLDVAPTTLAPAGLEPPTPAWCKTVFQSVQGLASFEVELGAILRGRRLGLNVQIK